MHFAERTHKTPPDPTGAPPTTATPRELQRDLAGFVRSICGCVYTITPHTNGSRVYSAILFQPCDELKHAQQAFIHEPALTTQLRDGQLQRLSWHDIKTYIPAQQHNQRRMRQYAEFRNQLRRFLE